MPGPAAPPPVANAHDPAGFAALVLQNLGVQPTKANTAALSVWFAHEGNNGPAGRNGVYNPLNVSHNGTVDNYTSVAQGVQSTANVIRQSNMSKIYAALKNPNSTSLQIAAAIENAPWAASHYGAQRAPNGTYVGGDLVKSFLPSAGGSPGVLSAVGDVGSSAIGFVTNPGKNISETAGAGESAAVSVAKSATTGVLGGVEKDIVYGLALFGGGFLVVVGLILIGVDVGLGSHANSVASRGRSGYNVLSPTRRRERSEATQRTARERDVRTQTAEARLYREQSNAESAKHRATVSRSNAKVAKAKAKAKTGKTGGDFPKGY